MISNRLVRCKKTNMRVKVLTVPIKKKQSLEISVIWQFIGFLKLLSEVMSSEAGAQFGLNWFNSNRNLQMLLWMVNLYISICWSC